MRYSDLVGMYQHSGELMETFNHPINTGEHECNNIPVFNNVRENYKEQSSQKPIQQNNDTTKKSIK